MRRCSRELDAAIRDGLRASCASEAGGERHRGRRALVGDRRRPARRLASPASRKPSSTSPASTTCVRKVKEVFASPLQRPRHRLPRAPRLQARGRVPVGRRAADGALRRRRLRRAVHPRHRIRLPRRGVRHRAATAWARMVVQGAVNPDEFYVYKPTLRRASRPSCAATLGTKQHPHGLFGHSPASACASRTRRPTLRTQFSISAMPTCTNCRARRWSSKQHYGRPMDIEWAKDGVTGKLYIVQARPETVKSRGHATQIERFHAQRARQGAGRRPRDRPEDRRRRRARRALASREMNRVQPGDVLVADMTDPDWEPIMKRAAAIVTNRGGRTCHAAIIARELGVPAVVGSGDATATASRTAPKSPCHCAEGDTGFIYEGLLPFERITTDLGNMPPAPLKIMMNVANPERAFDFAHAAERRHRPGAAGNDHRQPYRRASEGPARIRPARTPRPRRKIDERMAGYAEPGRLLRRSPGRRHRHDHGGVRAEPGDRAPVGLQVQRIRQPDRRQPATSRTKKTR